MKKIVGPMLFFLVILGFGNLVSAEEQSEERDAEKLKQLEQYIERSNEELNNTLNAMENKNVYLEDVEEVINKFYDENPIEEVVPDFEDADLIALNDSFNNNIKTNSTIDINELSSDFKNNLPEGSSYHKISNDSGYIEIFIANDGSIMILDHSETYEDSLSNLNVEPMAAWKNTPVRRTTGIGYNMAGGKLFTVWAEGQFSYNGSSVRTLRADGNAQRHIWSYNMTMTPRALGAKRNSGSSKEVYSRVYVETMLGFSFMNIPLKSATIEVYIGGAPGGSVYGSSRRI